MDKIDQKTKEEVLQKRVDVMHTILYRISTLKRPADKIKFSEILGGLIVYFKCELGDEL